MCDKVTDKGLSYLPEVVSIKLSGCDHISDNGLSYLTKLNTIYLSCRSAITENGFKNLSKLSHLKKVSVVWFDFHEEWFEHLQNIETLKVSCFPYFCPDVLDKIGFDKITDNGLKYLSNIKHSNIENSGNIITDKGLKNLQRVHTIFFPRHNTDKGLKYFSNVNTIYLTNNPNITNEGLKYLTGVENIIVWDCPQITEKGLKQIESADIRMWKTMP